MVFRVIKSIEKAQEGLYSIPVVPHVYNYLKHMTLSTDDELFVLSLKCVLFFPVGSTCLPSLFISRVKVRAEEIARCMIATCTITKYICDIKLIQPFFHEFMRCSRQIFLYGVLIDSEARERELNRPLVHSLSTMTSLAFTHSKRCLTRCWRV